MFGPRCSHAQYLPGFSLIEPRSNTGRLNKFSEDWMLVFEDNVL